jgi:alkanesulfonate monooxygenase SsuD/methylene tetrahydromethanopterin reductase-like flavin-dependent oxidoreductase (luciferase family)
MKIGIGLPAAIPGVETMNLVRWARQAEAHGFDALGVIDRVVYDNHEPLMALAVAAAVTERIELVTDVLIAPIRATTLLAKQAATLDRVSRGRLTLGLGLGGRAEDFTAVGMLTDGRGRRFDDQLCRLRGLWSGDRIGPSPARLGGPPLLVAGYVPRAIKRAARLADGWAMGVGTVQQFREGLTILRDAWADNRRLGRPRTLAMAYFALGNGARAVAEHDLHRYYRWLGPDVAADIAAGALTDPAAVVDWLSAYADAGAEEVLLMPCSPELNQVDLLAEALPCWHAHRPPHRRSGLRVLEQENGSLVRSSTRPTPTGRGTESRS